MSLAACGRVEAATASAELAVTVVVPDRCLVQAASHSATCTGSTVYALGVSREPAGDAASDLLTSSGEHAHTSGNGAIVTMSQPLSRVSAGTGADVATGPLRFASTGASPEAIRVTYSF